MTRESVKHKLLTDVFAKKLQKNGTEYYSPVEATFRRCFPSVHDFIRRFNRHGAEHANLIRELQRQESEFVIETVADDLTTRHRNTFFITLHDAIYARETDLPKVEAGFQRAFQRTGFRMAYKIAT